MEPRAVELDEHLFRHEAGRMVAALIRIFGVHNLALAEDVVQDAFCRALEVWKFRGLPENPSAWLMATAKHRAIDVLRRERTARTFAPELGRLIESEWTLAPTVHEFFGPNAIQDDELRMMFSCCHPRLAEPAQIALVLHILCGFSVNEVAAAFLSSNAAIEKRITRAKKVLAGSKKLFELSRHRFSGAPVRGSSGPLPAFQRGLSRRVAESAVRAELCGEALRLAGLLRRHPLASTPATLALGALMCLHAARLPGRVDASGDLHSLFEQDRSRWDTQLIAEGQRLLDLSATGTDLTEYHVEAAIASVHARAGTAAETDWQRVVFLYGMLMKIRPSPVVALNRAIAVAQHEGPERGLEAIRAIEGLDRLAAYPFYPAALGELELRCGRSRTARDHFCKALILARSPMERRFIERRIDACKIRLPSHPRSKFHPQEIEALKL